MGRSRKSNRALDHEKRAAAPASARAAAPAIPKLAATAKIEPSPSKPSPSTSTSTHPPPPPPLQPPRDPAPALDPRRAAALAVQRQAIERTKRGALGLASVVALVAIFLAALRQPLHVVLPVVAAGCAVAFLLHFSARRALLRLAPPPPARELLPFDFDDATYAALLDARPTPRARACVVFKELLLPEAASEVERELSRRCGEGAVTRFEARHLYVVAPPFAPAPEGERASLPLESWTRFVISEGLLSIHEHHKIELVRIEAAS